MNDQLTRALVLSGIAVFALLLWALSIALVLRDLQRRRLPGYEQAAWLALAALLPLIGGAAYLFARLLERIFSPRLPKTPEPENRLTAYKPPDKPPAHLQTVAAADLVRPPEVETESGQAADGRTVMSIEVIAGPLAGRRFAIETLPARIGRGPLIALSLDEDRGVSRHHAEIYESAGQLRIRDLQSAHGTSLNGKDIADERLNPGDYIAVGQSTLLFKMEAPDVSS